MHTSGGRVSILVNGSVYRARGEIKLNPARISTAVEANQDGSLYKTVKPMPAIAECSFDRFLDAQDKPLRWNDDILRMNNIAATYLEQDTGVTTLLTNASFVGEPSINLANGEVDGLKIAAESYEVVS